MQILLFLYGLVLGSFYNVVALRVPDGKSIVAPRSACPKCGHRLTFLELIPVFSYFIQGGKCRQCKARISPIYPFFELLTAALFTIAPFSVGWSGELLIALTLISMLVIITVSDLAYMIIPDRVLIVFAGLFFFERLLFPLVPWWDSLAGAAAGFFLLLAIAVVSKGGMGGGDIKLFAVIGFALGVKLLLLSFFLSTLFGAFFGVIGLLIGAIKRKQTIPFGPFIALGSLVAYFFGDYLIAEYMRLLTSGL